HVAEDADLASVQPPRALLIQNELVDGQLGEMALRPEVVWTVPSPPALLRLAPALPAADHDWIGHMPVGFGPEEHYAVRGALLDGVVAVVFEGRTDLQAQLLGWPAVGEQGGDIEGRGPRCEIDCEHWRILLEIPSAALVPDFGDGGEGW